MPLSDDNAGFVERYEVVLPDGVRVSHLRIDEAGCCAAVRRALKSRWCARGTRCAAPGHPRWWCKESGSLTKPTRSLTGRRSARSTAASGERRQYGRSFRLAGHAFPQCARRALGEPPQGASRNDFATACLPCPDFRAPLG